MYSAASDVYHTTDFTQSMPAVLAQTAWLWETNEEERVMARQHAGMAVISEVGYIRRWWISEQQVQCQNAQPAMLFVFVFLFGRIVHRTICIRPNSLKPLFSTPLVNCKSSFVWFGVRWHADKVVGLGEEVDLHASVRGSHSLRDADRCQPERQQHVCELFAWQNCQGSVLFLLTKCNIFNHFTDIKL